MTDHPALLLVGSGDRRYREYLLARPDLLALLPGLRGRRLGCWCVPEPCHAQVIADLADHGP